MMGEGTFRRAMQDIFVGPPDDLDLRSMWAALERDDGLRAAAALSAYHAERRHHEPEYTAALAHCPVPLTLLWGMDDPVSGAPMARHALRRTSTCRLVPLHGVGHYPQLEAPDAVAKHIARAERRVYGARISA